MRNFIFENLASAAPASKAIITVSIMLLTGFLMTRVTNKLKLPNVTAYIVAGILIGPFGFHFVPVDIVKGMDFVPDIALAFIAFSTGEFFKFSTLRQNGLKVMVITLLEAMMATIVVFVLTYFILKLDLAFSIVLAALASTTAPASTVMTIRQLGARGDFVDTLLQVVALDNIVGLLAYSTAISIAVYSYAGGVFSVGRIALPLAQNIGVLLLGAVFGVILHFALGTRHSHDNRLIISIALLFSLCGICTLLGTSPLLGCMSMAIVYYNMSDDRNLFQQLNYFSPPILLLFFVRSGISFDLRALITPSGRIGHTPLLIIGVLYFLVRIAGKYLGAWLGCLLVGKQKKTRNYLGLALIPQAGVAIGLVALGARTIGGEEGEALQTIVLAASVLYELIGPAAAKLSLYLSGSYSDRLEDMVEVEEQGATGEPKSSLELLIERIEKIQKEIPAHASQEINENEVAFTEAAERYQEARSPYRLGNFHRRRY